MSDNYTIQISLDDDTLQKLSETKQYLRAYKGVQASIEGGQCPIWFTTNDFSGGVNLAWTETYGGYIQSVELEKGVVITAENIQPMNIGDLLTANDDGVATVTTDGTPGNIDITNAGTKEWTCGMGQVVNNQMSPVCAFPLFGSGSEVLMLPYEQVLLVFESGQTDTGTVVEEAMSRSVVLTLTGADVNQTKNITFNIDTGWDAGGAKWAEINTGKISLADTLIHQMSSASKKAAVK